jgi:Protein of unknown function (DUF3318)
MNSELEIRRLLDLMPASGRMMSKLVSQPEQRVVLDCPLPLPWVRPRPIYINFDLWSLLTGPQRDLLLLRTVSWLGTVRWFQPNVNWGLVAIGVIGVGVEVMQQDGMGIAAAGALGAIALSRIWQSNHSSQLELEADEIALKNAIRRGYSDTEAARHLLAAIEAVAQLEARSLSFIDLVRCQNLRAIGGLSPVGIPPSLRQE